MPPKPKISMEEIIDNAFLMVKTRGIEALNARALAKELGCSTQPIFRHFINMEELKKQVQLKIDECYQCFIKERLDIEDYLFTMSAAYIEFARTKKHLFGALFVHPFIQERSIYEIVNSEWNLQTVAGCQKQYNISKEKAESLYRDVRFYCHGIAVQLYTGSVVITQEEIMELVRNAILRFI